MWKLYVYSFLLGIASNPLLYFLEYLLPYMGRPMMDFSYMLTDWFGPPTTVNQSLISLFSQFFFTELILGLYLFIIFLFSSPVRNKSKFAPSGTTKAKFMLSIFAAFVGGIAVFGVLSILAVSLAVSHWSFM